jgi:hypothetical protein
MSTQGDHKAVVEACTQGNAIHTLFTTHSLIFFPALRDDPDYIKALTRRAASNETIDTWSSLASAQEGPLCCHVVNVAHRTFGRLRKAVVPCDFI